MIDSSRNFIFLARSSFIKTGLMIEFEDLISGELNDSIHLYTPTFLC